MVPQVREEFESRYVQLHKRLTSLRAESEEVWKTLETAESTLMDMISAKDYDVTTLFAASAHDLDLNDGVKVPFLLSASASAASAASNAKASALSDSALVAAKLRADRQETEDFYLCVRSLSLSLSSSPSIPSPLLLLILLLTTTTTATFIIIIIFIILLLLLTITTTTFIIIIYYYY